MARPLPFPALTVLALALLALLMTAPAATAQATTTLSFTGLTGSEATQRSVQNFPFQVTLSVGRTLCPSQQGATYMVALSAEVEEDGPVAMPGNGSMGGGAAGNGSSGANTSRVQAQVLPAQVRFTFSPAEALAGATDTQDAVLEVTRGVVFDAMRNATVTVTGTITDATGCQNAAGEGTTTEGTVRVSFEPGEGAPAASGSGEQMPAVPTAVLLVALALGAMLRRRQ